MSVLCLQDVVRRYKEAHPGNWDLLPERVAFQVGPRSLNSGWHQHWLIPKDSMRYNHCLLRMLELLPLQQDL